jgi:hypothetical protein
LLLLLLLRVEVVHQKNQSGNHPNIKAIEWTIRRTKRRRKKKKKIDNGERHFGSIETTMACCWFSLSSSIDLHRLCKFFLDVGDFVATAAVETIGLVVLAAVVHLERHFCCTLVSSW